MKLKSQTTTKKRIKNIHPGEILLKDFLEPMKISRYRLAKETGIPESRLSAIVRGQQGITADAAHRLARFFGTSPELWTGLQSDYDLEETERKSSSIYESIRPLVMANWKQFYVFYLSLCNRMRTVKCILFAPLMLLFCNYFAKLYWPFYQETYFRFRKGLDHPAGPFYNWDTISTAFLASSPHDGTKAPPASHLEGLCVLNRSR